jgi:hypothetical protein
MHSQSHTLCFLSTQSLLKLEDCGAFVEEVTVEQLFNAGISPFLLDFPCQGCDQTFFAKNIKNTKNAGEKVEMGKMLIFQRYSAVKKGNYSTKKGNRGIIPFFDYTKHAYISEFSPIPLFPL